MFSAHSQESSLIGATWPQRYTYNAIHRAYVMRVPYGLSQVELICFLVKPCQSMRQRCSNTQALEMRIWRKFSSIVFLDAGPGCCSSSRSTHSAKSYLKFIYDVYTQDWEWNACLRHFSRQTIHSGCVFPEGIFRELLVRCNASALSSHGYFKIAWNLMKAYKHGHVKCSCLTWNFFFALTCAPLGRGDTDSPSLSPWFLDSSKTAQISTRSSLYIIRHRFDIFHQNCREICPPFFNGVLVTSWFTILGENGKYLKSLGMCSIEVKKSNRKTPRGIKLSALQNGCIIFFK